MRGDIARRGVIIGSVVGLGRKEDGPTSSAKCCARNSHWRRISSPKTQEAAELTRMAADLDASMEKHPATPAAVFPARELRADLLLEMNEPAAALKEYEESLRT